MTAVIVLVGSTATGKSALAVDLALSLTGAGQLAEIVNTDSMLVYRGMDIGTAKPTTEECRGVPHHLIDIMDLHQTASVAVFQGLARQAIADCHRRQVVPILVGGSALYLHAIIDHFDFPPTNEELRAQLNTELGQVGAQVLHDRLRDLDPASAAKIGPADSRRIVRALEAIELNGQFAPALPQWSYALNGVTQIGLDIDREQMDRRIQTRVDQMWQRGFVDEVRTLLNSGLRESPTASRAIGYRQIMAFLDHDITEAEARDLTVVRTRQFSRKQLSWWRRDPRIRWVPAGTPADQVLRMIGSKGVV